MAGSHLGACWSCGDLKRLGGAGRGSPGGAERLKSDSERLWIVSLLLVSSSSVGMSNISIELGTPSFVRLGYCRAIEAPSVILGSMCFLVDIAMKEGMVPLKG